MESRSQSLRHDQGIDLDAALHKIAWRIVPILFIAYIVSFVDRINVGFAQTAMKTDLGFGPAVYGLAAGAYALGYCLFEVPSNLLVDRVGARKTFTRIMVCWGVVSAYTFVVKQPWQFYTLRFVLGLFEAGFFPGIVLYLTFWFPSEARARMLSWFFVGGALAGVFGGIASGIIMQTFGGIAGLHGWQWMFLLEGLPAIIIGLFVWFYLPDSPQMARWLTHAEKQAVLELLTADRVAHEGASHHSFVEALKNPHVYAFIAVYFLLACGSYAIPYWLPVIIQDAGVHAPFAIGAYSAIPYGIGAIGIALISRHSDKVRERRWHYSLCAFFGACGLGVISVPFGSLPITLTLMGITVALVLGSIPVFWALPPKYLGRGGALAGGIALISSIGSLGGFVSPYVIGLAWQTTGSMVFGIGAMAVLLAISSVILLVTTRDTTGADGAIDPILNPRESKNAST